MNMLGYWQIKAADRIKVVNQITLRRGDYLDYLSGPNIIMRVLISRRRKKRMSD